MSDLRRLAGIGITEVTFADEDFLGGPLADAQQFVDLLQAANGSMPKFDASMTIHSVYSRRDTAAEREARRRLLAKLASMGLRKAFLGIESCSPSQLRRYAKGHTREEAAAAAHLLRQLGIRVEIGVILFDPLCTLDEIADSLGFMQDNDLIRAASWVSGELHLQDGSHYMSLLQKYEKQHGIKVYCDDLDPNTLSHSYIFVDKSVQDFFGMILEWNNKIIPFYYPAKNLSRFGEKGAVGHAARPLREAVDQFRDDSCSALLRTISEIKAGGDGRTVLDRCLGGAAASLARNILASVGMLSAKQTRHPVVRQTVTMATGFLSSAQLTCP
jgi:hypothetical protein